MDFCISCQSVNILNPSKLFSVPKHHKEVCQAKDVGLWLESLIEHLCHNFCRNLTTRTMQKVGNPPLQKIITLDESLERTLTVYCKYSTNNHTFWLSTCDANSRTLTMMQFCGRILIKSINFWLLEIFFCLSKPENLKKFRPKKLVNQINQFQEIFIDQNPFFFHF